MEATRRNPKGRRTLLCLMMMMMKLPQRQNSASRTQTRCLLNKPAERLLVSLRRTRSWTALFVQRGLERKISITTSTMSTALVHQIDSLQFIIIINHHLQLKKKKKKNHKKKSLTH